MNKTDVELLTAFASLISEPSVFNLLLEFDICNVNLTLSKN